MVCTFKEAPDPHALAVRRWLRSCASASLNTCIVPGTCQLGPGQSPAGRPALLVRIPSRRCLCTPSHHPQLMTPCGTTGCHHSSSLTGHQGPQNLTPTLRTPPKLVGVLRALHHTTLTMCPQRFSACCAARCAALRCAASHHALHVLLQVLGLLRCVSNVVGGRPRQHGCPGLCVRGGGARTGAVRTRGALGQAGPPRTP